MPYRARLLSLCSFLVLGAVAASAPARASTCVELDAAQDTLPEAEQRSARALFEQALANNGIPIVREGCTEIWRIYHLRLGQAVNVFVAGPRGNQQAQAGRIEDLPAVYDQTVKALLWGQGMTGANQTVTRHTVTNQQASPRRVEADSVKYVRLGYGGVLGTGQSSGPAFGLGYRYELDSLGIDFSFLNLLIDTADDQRSAGISGSLIKLQGLYFLDPVANGSLYLGAGISWGWTAIAHTGGAFGGSGLQGEATVGYEFLRASTIRMFAQLDATLPLYLSDRVNRVSNLRDETWAPHLVLSVGIGWGRGLSRVQVLY